MRRPGVERRRGAAVSREDRRLTWVLVFVAGCSRPSAPAPATTTTTTTTTITSASASASASVAPPIARAGERIEVEVEGYLPAVVTVPTARPPRPVMVALHGTGDRP